MALQSMNKYTTSNCLTALQLLLTFTGSCDKITPNFPPISLPEFKKHYLSNCKPKMEKLIN